METFIQETFVPILGVSTVVYFISLLACCIFGLVPDIADVGTYEKVLISMFCYPLVGVLIFFVGFYALGNTRGNNMKLTTSGANYDNIEKAKRGDFYCNPPEDMRTGMCSMNQDFYPDGSLKYVRDVPEKEFQVVQQALAQKVVKESVADDVLDRINTAKQLLDSGIITEEEYTLKRKDILDKL